MNIKELEITNFGKIENKNVVFQDGINVVYGQNEKGKTTIHRFIESIFSLSKSQESKAIDLYKPWRNPEIFAGKLKLEVDDDNYNLDADFSEMEIKIDKNGEGISELNDFRKRIFLNLIGIQEIESSSVKGFIEEIKSHIVNIKNANNISIDYEKTITRLDDKIDDLNQDQFYVDIISKCSDIKDKLKASEMEKKELGGYPKVLYQERKALNNLENEQVIIEESMEIEKHEQLENQLGKINDLNAKLSDNEKAINSVELFQVNAKEDIDEYIDDMKGLEATSDRIDETLSEIEDLNKQKKRLDLNQSEKAIKLMAEDMYANDFALDVESYLTTQEVLEEMSASMEEADFKAIQAKAEEEVTIERNLESDYLKVQNLRKQINNLEKQQGAGLELISNKTKLEMLEVNSKPMIGYTIFTVILLVGMLLAVALLPQYRLLAGIASAILLIVVIILATKHFKNKQLINQTRFILQELEREIDGTNKKISNLKVELAGVFNRHGLSEDDSFEHYYMIKKQEIILRNDPTKEYKDNENKISELTFNKSMLHRRVKKWIDDTELKDVISIEEKAGIVDIIRTHANKCVQYMNISNDIIRQELMLKKLNEELKEKRDFINGHPNYELLKDYSLDEVLQIKGDYNSLLGEKKDFEENVVYLLDGKKYEDLVSEIGDNKAHIDSLDKQNRVFGTLEELDNQRRILVERILNIQSDINKIGKKINQLALIKGRIENLKRELLGYEEILIKRDVLENEARESLEIIKIVSETISAGYNDDLTEAIGSALYRLTNKYDKVSVTDSYDIFIKDKDNDRWVSIEELSLGLLDQLYLAVRLGLMDTVNRDGVTPLVFDDCFIRYDDDRLKRVLDVLSKLKRQIIILTCQKREQQLLTEIDVTHNFVSL